MRSMTPEHHAIKLRIRDLWQSGMSTQAIADALGITKNSVVSHSHRIPECKRRASPIIRTGLPSKKAARKIKLAVLATPIPLPVMTGEPLLSIVPDAPVALALDGKGCQFPLRGDRERPTHRYCDAPVVRPGVSWCRSCLDRVSHPAAVRMVAP